MAAAATSTSSYEGDDEEAAACTAPAAVGSVRVVAGEFGGFAGAAKTFTPIDLWDVKIDSPNVPVRMAIPEGHNTIVFVRKGGVVVGESGSISPQGLAILGTSGTSVELTATEEGTQIVVLAGKPLDEPIAARGPFVMNTDREIMEANRDYRMNRMGR